tara:strand:- start:148 stop:453 length:306 start_codon:yes stop_codon:yes gene_type:complete
MSNQKEILSVLNKTDLLLNDVIHLTRNLFKGDNFKNNVKNLFNKTFRINDSQNILLNNKFLNPKLKNKINNKENISKKKIKNTKKHFFNNKNKTKINKKKI